MKILLLLLLSACSANAADLTLNRSSNQLIIANQTFSIVENPDYLIKAGTYKVILSYSSKFRHIMPEIVVEGRTGLRIHVVKNLGAGNALQGCVGMLLEDYNKLFALLEQNNTITIN